MISCPCLPLTLTQAFEKLDLDECLPAIFCEANDLLSLPTLDLDPISKQLELNTCAVKSLTDTVLGLQSNAPRSTTPEIASNISTSVDSLKKIVQDC